MSLDRKPRLFGYARASTKKQEASPETQKDAIKEYARLHAMGDVTMFTDPATTAKKLWKDRPAGKELFRQLRHGDIVIVSKLDRAFRRVADCAEVIELFERMGVRLHVTNMLGVAIDLSSAMGKFLLHIFSAVAELERNFISERIRDGLAIRKKHSVRHCNHAGYGFRWEKRIVDGKRCSVRVPDNDERDAMKSIVVWRTQRDPLSWDEICEHLNDNLRLKTKEGKRWDVNRIRRVYKAELALQLQAKEKTT